MLQYVLHVPQYLDQFNRFFDEFALSLQQQSPFPISLFFSELSLNPVDDDTHSFSSREVISRSPAVRSQT